MNISRFTTRIAAIALGLTAAVAPTFAASTLLNVSYDPTRELYVDYNAALNVAGAITKVPGGVGPMTITMLMVNTMKAAKHLAQKLAM